MDGNGAVEDLDVRTAPAGLGTHVQVWWRDHTITDVIDRDTRTFAEPLDLPAAFYGLPEGYSAWHLPVPPADPPGIQVFEIVARDSAGAVHRAPWPFVGLGGPSSAFEVQLHLMTEPTYGGVLVRQRLLLTTALGDAPPYPVLAEQWPSGLWSGVVQLRREHEIFSPTPFAALLPTLTRTIEAVCQFADKDDFKREMAIKDNSIPKLERPKYLRHEKPYLSHLSDEGVQKIINAQEAEYRAAERSLNQLEILWPERKTEAAWHQKRAEPMLIATRIADTNLAAYGLVPDSYEIWLDPFLVQEDDTVALQNLSNINRLKIFVGERKLEVSMDKPMTVKNGQISHPDEVFANMRRAMQEIEDANRENADRQEALGKLTAEIARIANDADSAQAARTAHAARVAGQTGEDVGDQLLYHAAQIDGKGIEEALAGVGIVRPEVPQWDYNLLGGTPPAPRWLAERVTVQPESLGPSDPLSGPGLFQREFWASIREPSEVRRRVLMLCLWRVLAHAPEYGVLLLANIAKIEDGSEAYGVLYKVDQSLKDDSRYEMALKTRTGAAAYTVADFSEDDARRAMLLLEVGVAGSHAGGFVAALISGGVEQAKVLADRSLGIDDEPTGP